MAFLPFTPLEKGYTCPDYEDCTKCELKNTDCIIYSAKGKKRLQQLIKERKQNEKCVSRGERIE